MASALPVLSGRKVVRVFTKFGWRVIRQSSSHIIMETLLRQYRDRFGDLPES